MRFCQLAAITILLTALGGAREAAAQPAAGPAPTTTPAPGADPVVPAEPAAPAAPPAAPTAPPAAPTAEPAVPTADPEPAAPAPWQGPSGQFGPPSAYVPPAAPPGGAGQPLSEGVALALSLGGTVVSWGLLIGSADTGSEGLAWFGLLGTFLAPTAGHWYRGAIVTRGMGIRALGFLIGAYGVVQAIGCEEGCNEDTILLQIYGGLALYLGGTIDDIVTAPGRVRAHNRRLQQVQVAPLVAPRSAGLSIIGRF